MVQASSTAHSGAAVPSPVPTRRNGRPQACEPCRKRKVACDHTHPICRRCTKRKQESDCVYLTSDGVPLSPARTTPSSSTTRRGSENHNVAPSVSVPESGVFPTTPLGSPPERPRPRHRQLSSASANIPVAANDGKGSPATTSTSPGGGGAGVNSAPGYLGFTSFCTIFEETERTLNQLRNTESDNDAFGDVRGNRESNSDAAAVQFNNAKQQHEQLRQLIPTLDQHLWPSSTLKSVGMDKISPTLLSTGIAILRHLPPLRRARLYFDRRQGLMDSWLRPIVRKIQESFYADLMGGYFSLPSCPPNSPPQQQQQYQKTRDLYLETVARRLYSNTAKPMSDDERDGRKWLSQFTGVEGLRWECVGLLFSFWETATLPGERTGEDVGWAVAQQNRECMFVCVDICREFSTSNSLILALSLRRAIVESIKTGDVSLATWRARGETAALLTFVGFHAQPNEEPQDMCLTSQIKRLLFSMTYILDLVSTSFTGRPSNIFSHYCTTPLPLDIEGEGEEVLEDSDFATAASKLDENGWNRNGVLTTTTMVRARMQIAFVREDIFHAALGPQHKVTIASLLELKERQLSTERCFPPCLDVSLSALNEIDGNSMVRRDVWFKIIVRLEHLHNLFFIERLLLRHGYSADRTDRKENLLSVSVDLISFSLPFWTHLDRFINVRPSCEWVVMAFAVPAGGILCDELLKPTVRDHSHNPQLARSNIIQKLSLLVGFLDWVRPSAPNGDLCMDTKRVLQHALDRALNHHPGSGVEGFGGRRMDQGGGVRVNGNGGNGVAGVDSDFFENFDLDFSTQLDFNFDLLDTYDFLRPDGAVPSSSQQSA